MIELRSNPDAIREAVSRSARLLTRATSGAPGPAPRWHRVRQASAAVMFILAGSTTGVHAMTPEQLASLSKFLKAEQEAERAKAAESATPRVAALRGYWEYQGDLPLCAFYTEKHVLEAYLGQRLPADGLFEWYAASGTYDFRAAGVPYDRMGTALKVKGYSLQHLTLSEASLRTMVGKGYAVMVPVNPLFYWSPDDPMVDFQVDLEHRDGASGVDHVVWILDATPDRIYIQDSAVENGGEALAVRWDDFRRAWAPAHGQALVVATVLPPIDSDRDGVPLTDADHDGHASSRSGGDDCDDNVVAVHPGAVDAQSNGIDEDCDGRDAVPSSKELAHAAALQERDQAVATAAAACAIAPGAERMAALWDARDRLAALLTKYPNTNFGNDVGAKMSVIDREIAGGPCEP